MNAEQLASDIRGVLDVINRLTVIPTKKVSDENIAQDIVAALDRNVSVDSANLGVKVENAIVTLSGTVQNWGAKTAAFFTAFHTRGVIQVDDRLTVKPLK